MGTLVLSVGGGTPVLDLSEGGGTSVLGPDSGISPIPERTLNQTLAPPPPPQGK